MSPQQFDEWLAFDALEPDAAERFAEILKRGFALLATCQGAKIDPADLDPVKAETPPAAMTADQAVAVLKSEYRA